MKAMLLNGVFDLTKGQSPLSLHEIDIPQPETDEVLIKVKACGVCHTEIDEIEGRLIPPAYPVIPGHQVTGEVVSDSPVNKNIKRGDSVGVAWIYHACGKCHWCLSGYENLCPSFKATGRDVNGGYAEYIKAKADFVYKIPDNISYIDAAPMLCAGAIGYRSVKLANIKDGQVLGLSGFGASAHLVVKLVKYLYPSTEIIVFARNASEQQFAIELGAKWAGDFSDTPPLHPDSIIDTTPVWTTVIKSLEHLTPGGRLIINAIRKENIDQNYLLHLDYPRHLWMEKEIKSVANVTRADVSGFLEAASAIPIKPAVQLYSLKEANTAIIEIKQRKIKGAKVLVMDM
jgi:propanol-preferring alcohol dehydrogenase